jgi:pyridoxal phosphate enzyme (YggS family)
MAVQTHVKSAYDFRKKLTAGQKLLAVSKKQPVEKIIQMHNEGQIDFGENYIQEAIDKITQLSHLNIKWHMIGPLQKNKIKFLKNHFEYIHSIDSVEIAERVSEKSIQIQHVQKIFIQLNLSNENSKSGFSEQSLIENWQILNQLQGLRIVGLMTMPPLQNNAYENRIYFQKCFRLGQRLDLKEFSMGTSHDFDIALSEGATWIRLGTILFGKRQKNDSSPTS